MKKSLKNWLALGVLIAVAIIVYFGYFNNNTTTDEGLLEQQPDGELVGQQILMLLNQIESLRIDKAFFQSQAYVSLIDHTVEIPDQGVGRPNPFAPIPGYNPPKPSTVPRR